ncbi:MAG: hypothetical protein WCW47_01455 [Candidatus Paceibacterota bacterium]|jgi:hypothetical protein
MGKWPKPKRDWNQKPKVYPETTHFTREEIERIRAGRGPEKPDSFKIMNGGLRERDYLLIDWMIDDGPCLNGVRVAAYRGKALLKWTPAGWLRDAGGRCLYAPYLRSWSEVGDFAEMLAMSCGYTPVPKDEGPTHRRFVLETVVGESRRLIPQDQICFGADKVLQVVRQQGTIDMSLYRPPGTGSCIMSAPVGYVYMAHHPPVIARLLAEANALYVKSVGDDTFEVISP